MVTSSAVVGSSAISSLGLQAIAMAIITRWLCPPDIWCGKDVEPLGRVGNADLLEQFDARACAARRLVHAECGSAAPPRSGSRP